MAYSSFTSALALGLSIVLVTACTPKASLQGSPAEVKVPTIKVTESFYKQSRETVELLPLTLKRNTLSAFPSLKPRPRSSFSLVAVGDMMLGTNYPDPKYLPPGDGSQLLAPMLDILRSATVTIGNLEGTLLNEGGTPKSCQNPDACYAFRSPESYASHFSAAGFDFLSIANNHSGDFGPIGRSVTKQRLQEQGIAYAGLLETDEIAYRKIEGIHFAFIAFAPNSGTVDIRDLPRARQLVEQASTLADIVIVSFHGGAEGPDAQHVPRATEEYYKENRGNVYAFAHTVVDAGADIVIGHGPHVTRGLELYKDRLIAYSLGNFATYGRFNLNGPAGVAPLLKATLSADGKFESGEIISIYQTKPTGPLLDERGRALSIIRRLSIEDFPESPLIVGADGQLSVRSL